MDNKSYELHNIHIRVLIIFLIKCLKIYKSKLCKRHLNGDLNSRIYVATKREKKGEKKVKREGIRKEKMKKRIERGGNMSLFMWRNK